MNVGRFLVIARMESRDAVTRPLFWLMIVSVALATASLNPAAMIPTGDPSVGGDRPFINTPFAMSNIFALSGVLLYGFFASILAGFAIIRDDEHKVSELLHSTPLTPSEYILGKFAGVMTALGAVLLIQVLLAIVFFQFIPVENPEEIRGPFRLSSFAIPALAFTAPLIWLCAGLAFAVGERTRKPLLVLSVPLTLFLASVFFLWRWTPSWLDVGVDRLLIILDPSSLRWLTQTVFKVDRGVDFYNTRPIPFDSTFLWNRLVTLVIPALAILSSIRHCRTAKAGARPSRGRVLRPSHASAAPPPKRDPATGELTFRRLELLEMMTSPPSFLSSTLQIARSELRELRAHPGLYAFAPLVMLMVWEYAASASGSLDAPVLVTAGGIAVGAIERITIPICLLLLFYTVEAVTRDRTTGFESILHTLPFRTGAILVARSLANAVVVAVILLGCTVTGLLFLAVQDRGRVEVWPFALVWGLALPPTFLVWNSFVMVVLAIVRERYTTYAIGLLALMLSAYHQTRSSMSWVYNWNLWGTLRWSDMGAFTLNGRALLLNRIAMVALAVFLSAVAVRLFSRVERDTAGVLHRLAPGLLLRGVLRLAPFALVPIVVGTYLAAEVSSGFQNEAVKKRAEEYQRRNVATWRDFVPGTVIHVDLAIRLKPKERVMEVDGTFTMVNQSDRAMGRLPFTVGPAAEGVSWRVNGSEADFEDRSGLHVLEPARPLLPGDEIRIGVRYRAVMPKGMTRNGGGVSEFILPSGVSLHTMGPNLLPVPGFNPEIGIASEYRPDPREYPDDFWEAELGPVGGMPDRFTTRVEVTAPSEYTVNSVGVKTAESTRDGQTTVVWSSDDPVRHFNIIAGRWEVRHRDGTAVFHHPGHPYNIEEISETLAAARRRYSEWFHPYPWKELRLSQIPNEIANAKGFPTNIAFSEGIGFLAKRDPRAPLAFIVTAHEAAHQWWGNLLTPGEGPGADVMIEGMAHYSALLLLESERGLRGRIEFARRLEESYGEGRRVDAERPLVKTGDGLRPGDETVVYDKGAWVMWMLHNHLGRDRTLAGLQEFIRSYMSSRDHPAIQDLVRTLRPFAADPEAYQTFIDQWFFDVVIPEYRITDAVVARSGDRWEVAATVENIGTGTATVEVAAARGDRFAEDLEVRESAYRDARIRVLLVSRRPTQVTWTVDFEPERLVVDPDALVLQLNRNRALAEL